MVTERLSLKSGKKEYKVEVDYDIKSYKNSFVLRPFSIPTEKLQWFVEWNKGRQCSVFDASAPRWYIKLAALGNTICETGKYEDLIDSQLPPIGNPERHVEVEKFIIGISGNYRSVYIAARRSMYQTVLDIRFCTPTTELVIRQVKDYLDSLVA